MPLPLILRIPLAALALTACGQVLSLGLDIGPAPVLCAITTATAPPPPAAQARLADSQAVAGPHDIAWVWLGSPTPRYPHAALGSRHHAGSLHVLTARGTTLTYELPIHRVFEDRVPRLADLDGDGRDEIIVIEADARHGAALVVLGLQGNDPPRIVELARGPYAGGLFRWLNPVGVADFDGDGRLDIASVTTPHIGGVLTLHHVRPPQLVPYATLPDVSNHRMGALEQQLAAIVQPMGQRPVIIVPDMSLRALQALRWDAPGQWSDTVVPLPLRAPAQRMTALADGACVLLTDGSWWRVTLQP